MRRASIMSTLLGAFFLAMAIAVPAILRWQTELTLAQMGASTYVDRAVSANLERLGFDLLVSKVLSAALLISGVLMLRRLKQGLFLGLCTYAIYICVALYSFTLQERAFTPLLKALVWVYAFYYLLAAHRMEGISWWRQSN